MDASIENQLGRVIAAFRKAADKHWGPELSDDPSRLKRPRSESKERSAARAFLLDNPTAKTFVVAAATGAGKQVIAEVRRELGFQIDLTRNSENRSRVISAFEADPNATAKEIARIAGVRERYAQDMVRRLRREREGAS